MNDFSRISKPKKEDYLYAAIKAGYNSIPLVGSALGELMQFVLVPPIEKRKESFFNSVAESIKKLEEKGKIKYDDLKDDEQFLDTIYTIASLVQKNSEEEKLTAFKNAIINTAIKEVPEKSISQMFLSFLDRYTIWHLRILLISCDPLKWALKVFENPNESTTIDKFIFKNFPELTTQEEFTEIIYNDLVTDGLIKKKTFFRNTGVLLKGKDQTLKSNIIITGFASMFIRFISEYEQNKESLKKKDS